MAKRLNPALVGNSCSAADLAGRRNVESLDIGMVNYAEFATYFSRQECDLVHCSAAR
jgi:hypothetical protein